MAMRLKRIDFGMPEPRKFDCAHYGQCLDCAARTTAPGFGCASCRRYCQVRIAANPWRQRDPPSLPSTFDYNEQGGLRKGNGGKWNNAVFFVGPRRPRVSP